MGVNTTRAKVTAFALSGFITGLVGAAYAFQQVTIFPERLFDVDITVLMVVMVVIGGSGTVLGPLLGAVVLQFLSEYLRQNYTDAAHLHPRARSSSSRSCCCRRALVNYVREARAYRRVLVAGATSGGTGCERDAGAARPAGWAGASAACKAVADVSLQRPRGPGRSASSAPTAPARARSSTW